VEWFNMVGATYRSDLRDLDERIGKLRAETAQLIAEVNHRIAELRSEMRVGFKHADLKSEQLETRLTKRLFGFWVAQAATTVGLIFGVVKLLG
jgi:uncharacterized small protein (DUF1192 family)